ncbi:MAG: hypothetical protein R3264_22670 [Anaerolineae bacterium]|nr:hypothetical protein [Anaerolineae bacterium]
MNPRNYDWTSKPATCKDHLIAAVSDDLPKYLVWVGIGVLGGVTGVAATIALIISVQALLFPTTPMALPAMLLTIAVSIVSLGTAWAFVWAAQHTMPGLYRQSEQSIQVIFTISVLMAVLEAVIFFM